MPKLMCVPANRCPPVPSVANASPNTIIAEAGTTVTITCHKGYEFPDGTKSKKVTCFPTILDWTGLEYDACQCKCCYSFVI